MFKNFLICFLAFFHFSIFSQTPPAPVPPPPHDGSMPEFNISNVLKLGSEKIIAAPPETCSIVDEILRVINVNRKEILSNKVTQDTLFRFFYLKKLLVENYSKENCKLPVNEYFYRLNYIEDEMIVSKSGLEQLSPKASADLLSQLPMKEKIRKHFVGEFLKLENGDFVLASNSTNSTIIARALPPHDSMYEIPGIVYINPATQVPFLIVSLKEKGLTLMNFYEFVNRSPYRFAVFRPKDKNLANQVAQNAFNFYKNLPPQKARFFYDYKYDIESNQKQYHTEFLYKQYSQVKKDFFSTNMLNNFTLKEDSYPAFEMSNTKFSMILPLNFIQSKDILFIGEWKNTSLVLDNYLGFVRNKFLLNLPINDLLEKFSFKDKLVTALWPYRENKLILKTIEFILGKKDDALNSWMYSMYKYDFYVLQNNVFETFNFCSINILNSALKNDAPEDFRYMLNEKLHMSKLTECFKANYKH